jgi:hypothetical protein
MTNRLAVSASVLLTLLALGGAARAQPSTGTAWLVVTTPVEDAVLLVDGEPLPPGQERVAVSPGQHTVTAELRDGRYWDAIVDVAAGTRREVRLGPRAPEADVRADVRAASVPLVARASVPGPRLPDRYPSRSLNPVWRLVGLGVTTLLTTCLVVFALETQSLSDAYQRDPTQASFDEGTRFKDLTQYGLFPATLGSIGLTVLAFVLSTPSAD